jgi:zeaxanthin glucosyltransferase
MDIEEGHLIPSLSLALSLKAKGYEVVYMGVPDNEDIVRKYRFSFYPIWEDIYPAGFQRRNKELIKQQGYKNAVTQKHHFGAMLIDDFTVLRMQIKPDLCIVSCFLSIEALILYYRFGVKSILLTTFLHKKGVDTASACMDEIMKMSTDEVVEFVDLLNRLDVQVNSLSELVAPLKSFFELIVCPEELETGHLLKKENVLYIGPSILQNQGKGDHHFDGTAFKGKKVIYASLGSQAITYGKDSEKFYHTLLAVMRREDMQDLHLILSIGMGNEGPDLLPNPENVTVFKWVSQVDVLKIASLAIVHGGLGTIKECIFFGVPMIVIPFNRDQPDNARRVDYHRLGKTFRIETITVENLSAAIRQVPVDDRIKEGIGRMQEIFKKKEEDNLGVAVIERLLGT